MAGKVKAGEAFILIRAVDKASPVLTEVGRKFKEAGRKLMTFGVMFGAVGGIITKAFVKPVKIASDVTEQQNKFFQIFGTKVGKEVEDRMKGIGKETGRTHLKMYKFAGSFGGLLKGQGATTEFAASMTKSLLSMGVDFSSFNDIMDDTREGSMRRFTSALSGSAEVLDQYGVAAKESALGPALEKMFGVGVKGATALQKSTARAYLIYKSMKQQRALGDAPRTMTELANAARNFKDQIYEIQYWIGKALLPILGAAMQYLIRAGQWAAAWAESHKNTIIVIALIAAGLLAVGSIIAVVGAAIYAMGIVLGMIAQVLVVIKVLWTAIAAITAFITGNIGMIILLLFVAVAVISVWAIGLATILNMFSTLIGHLVFVGKAIWKAFSTGRFELAWALFFNQLKTGWQYMVMGAQKAAAGLAIMINDVASRIAMHLTNMFDTAWVKVLEGWYRVQSGLLSGIEAIARKLAGFLKQIGQTEAGNYMTAMAEEISNKRKEISDKAISNDAALSSRIESRAARRGQFMEQVGQVTEEWWKDNERNIAKLKEEAQGLLKEVYKPEDEEEIIPSEPEKGGAGAGAAASMKTVMPEALERGTIAASKKARQNAQTAALQEIAGLTQEGNEQRAAGNAMLNEFLSTTGGV